LTSPQEADWAEIDLSPAEEDALRKYAGVDYHRRINEKLRNGDPLTPEEQKLINTIDRALNKSPSYQGVLWRGVNTRGPLAASTEDILNQFPLGKTVKVPEYMSTTTSKKIMEGHKGNDGVIIGIRAKGRNGRVISREVNSAEHEVLFKRGTRFKAVRNEREGNKGLIVLEEV
jgi:hypothetical protein